MSSPRRNERGFAAIEALLSVALFAVVAGALSASTVGSMKANRMSRDVSVATALIYNKFDEVRSFNPNNAGMANGSYSDPSNPITPLGTTNGKYTRTWVVTRNKPRVGVAEVVVRVSWAKPNGKTLQGVTYVCLTNTCAI